jgi:Odorant response abnormal 4-like
MATNLNTFRFSSKGHSTKNIDWKFQEMTSTWKMIETVYEINEIFPFAQKDTEANLLDTLEVIGQRVKDSMVFLDGRPASDDQALGALFDGKCGDSSDHQVQSHIYFPCVS